ncbi:MAG: flagellin, partial [Pseudomonadota bacterium]
QDLTDDAGVFGTGTGLAGNVTFAAGSNQDADGTGANASNAGNILTATVAGTIVIGETYNFQVAGETVSFTTTTTVAADLATGIIGAINSAQIEGITAAVGGAATEIDITNTRAFEDVTVNTSSPNGGAATFALAAGDSAGGTSTAAAATNNTLDIASRASDVTFSSTASVGEGDGYRVTLNGTNYDYIAGRGETMEDVARGLKLVIDGAAVAGISTNVVQKGDDFVLEIDNDNAAAATVVVTGSDAGTGTASGGLLGVDTLDVTTDEGVEAALANIETLISNSIDAAADFGSALGRLETQSGFITSLTDSLKSGIGSLVDADLEAASARLQALQVQQQLATQSLSIANQAPQSILSLFR